MVAAAAVACVHAGPAGAAPAPVGYAEAGSTGFRDIMPPGANGHTSFAEIGAFLSTGARPPHSNDQLLAYRDLLYASPGIDQAGVERHFKDSTLGIRPEDIERTIAPRPDVTVAYDRFGVPHISGETREATMFGTGYATAASRLFFMDVLRHTGRGQLSSFAGGSPYNRAVDRLVWESSPYTEEDLEAQLNQQPPPRYADLGGAVRQARADLASYTAGVNQYIREARLDPRKMPGEYAAINRPEGPEDWLARDAVAIAIVPGATLGTGGGRELDAVRVLEEAQSRFGRRGGSRIFRDFRQEDEPESPTTVHRGRFTYSATPRRRARRSLALPDRGTLTRHDVLAAATGSGGGDVIGPRTGRATSNALLVSARESESGRPIAVFGPQAGYFSPAIFMEQEIHAPARDGVPGLHARGVSFAGTNLYVQLGHGVDYAWSATTSAHDLIDTFALDLCEPDGSAPTLESMHYSFRGACLPIEVLERRNAWSPNAADSTPEGSETLRAQRTRLGLVAGRGTIGGRPVAYTKLRSTYMHEPDSGVAFSLFNSPDMIKGADDFQRAASLVAYAFNWFYADETDIAYQNGGANPVRARGTDPNLPIRGRRGFEWRAWDPDTARSDITPRSSHPHVKNQAWIADWNNKQAKGYRAADSNWGYGSVYRVKPLADRLRRGTRGAAKMSLPEVVDAMADAATVDLRGDAVLPLALQILRGSRDPEVRAAADTLEAWRREGSHRIDRDQDGEYEHAEAVRIMDAWWPLWVRAEFEPALGAPLFEAIRSIVGIDNEPNNRGEHLGSAYQDGWYGFVHKDLRAVLGRRVRRPLQRTFCGRGRLAACRVVLERTLKEAVATPAAETYEDAVCAEAGRAGDQACFDSLYFRPTGAVTHPLIPWQNRPTFQQAVEVQGDRPR